MARPERSAPAERAFNGRWKRLTNRSKEMFERFACHLDFGNLLLTRRVRPQRDLRGADLRIYRFDTNGYTNAINVPARLS